MESVIAPALEAATKRSYKKRKKRDEGRKGLGYEDEERQGKKRTIKRGRVNKKKQKSKQKSTIKKALDAAKPVVQSGVALAGAATGAAGAGAGAIVGGAIGSLGGPVGSVMGAKMGAAIGSKVAVPLATFIYYFRHDPIGGMQFVLNGSKKAASAMNALLPKHSIIRWIKKAMRKSAKLLKELVKYVAKPMIKFAKRALVHGAKLLKDAARGGTKLLTKGVRQSLRAAEKTALKGTGAIDGWFTKLTQDFMAKRGVAVTGLPDIATLRQEFDRESKANLEDGAFRNEDGIIIEDIDEGDIPKEVDEALSEPVEEGDVTNKDDWNPNEVTDAEMEGFEDAIADQDKLNDVADAESFEEVRVNEHDNARLKSDGETRPVEDVKTSETRPIEQMPKKTNPVKEAWKGVKPPEAVKSGEAPGVLRRVGGAVGRGAAGVVRGGVAVGGEVAKGGAKFSKEVLWDSFWGEDGFVGESNESLQSRARGATVRGVKNVPQNVMRLGDEVNPFNEEGVVSRKVVQPMLTKAEKIAVRRRGLRSVWRALVALKIVKGGGRIGKFGGPALMAGMAAGEHGMMVYRANTMEKYLLDSINKGVYVTNDDGEQEWVDALIPGITDEELQSLHTSLDEQVGHWYNVRPADVNMATQFAVMAAPPVFAAFLGTGAIAGTSAVYDYATGANTYSVFGKPFEAINTMSNTLGSIAEHTASAIPSMGCNETHGVGDAVSAVTGHAKSCEEQRADEMFAIWAHFIDQMYEAHNGSHMSETSSSERATNKEFTEAYLAVDDPTNPDADHPVLTDIRAKHEQAHGQVGHWYKNHGQNFQHLSLDVEEVYDFDQIDYKKGFDITGFAESVDTTGWGKDGTDDADDDYDPGAEKLTPAQIDGVIKDEMEKKKAGDVELGPVLRAEAICGGSGGPHYNTQTFGSRTIIDAVHTAATSKESCRVKMTH